MSIVCALVAYCHAGLLGGAYSSVDVHAPAYGGYAAPAAYAPVSYAAPVLKAYAPVVKHAPVDYYVSIPCPKT